MSISFYLNFFWYDNVSDFLQVFFHFYLFCFLFSTPTSHPSPQITGFSCICFHEWYLLSFSFVSGTVLGTACTVLRRIGRTSCPQGSHIQQQKPVEIRAFYRKVRVRKAFGIWTSLLIIVSRFHTGYVLHLWLESHFSLFLLFLLFLLLLFPKYKQVAVCEDSFIGWISDTIILLFAVTKGSRCVLRTKRNCSLLCLYYLGYYSTTNWNILCNSLKCSIIFIFLPKIYSMPFFDGWFFL